MNYAVTTDAEPLLDEMAKHADAGLPFLAIEFDPATYQVETPVGLSRMPTYDDIEAANMEGSNAYDVASYRHLLAIAVGITGVNYGNGLYGVNIATEDGRHMAVVPVTEAVAYRPLNDVERKALAVSMRPPVEGDGLDNL
jgi:hypothetical protein